MNGERNRPHIPRVEYIDGMPEIAFIPIDEFATGVLLTLAVMWTSVPLILVPIILPAVIVAYRRFKKKYTKNFYMLIPYLLGWGQPKGVPPVTAREFAE